MRGRIRTVKPEALKDEELWDLEVSTGFPLYRAFQGLWMYADREGRFEWRPRALKSDILPYWDGDFSAVLDALEREGFVVRYTVAGRDYGWVPTLKDHQRFDHREPDSVLPAPHGEVRPGTPGHAEETPGRARVEGKGTEGNGKGTEGNGREPEPAPPSSPVVTEIRPTQLAKFVPPTWQPNDTHRMRCQELRFDLEELVRSFRLQEFNREYSDWDKRFSKWIEQERINRETASAKTLAQQRGRSPPPPTKGRPAAEVMREMREYENAEWERRHAAAQAAKAAKAAQAK